MWLGQLGQCANAETGHRTRHQHFAPWGRRYHRLQCDIQIEGKICLRQHHDRGRAAAPAERQQSLDPAEVNLAGQRDNHDHHVDVGREHLRDGSTRGLRPIERSTPGQHGHDPGALAGRVDRDPVARAYRLGGLAHSKGAEAGMHVEGGSIHPADAPRDDAGVGQPRGRRGIRISPPGVPAERDQQVAAIAHERRSYADVGAPGTWLFAALVRSSNTAFSAAPMSTASAVR